MEAIESTYLYHHGGYVLVAAVAIFTILGTMLVAHLLVKVMYRTLKKTTGGVVGGSIVANIIRVAIWFVSASCILKWCFNYNTSVLWGALGVGGIALSLGLQNTISNLIGGLQVSLSRDFKMGDWISIRDITGKIDDITWRVVKMEDADGNSYIIPNAVFNSNAVTVLPPFQTTDLTFEFSSMADLEAIGEKLPQLAYDALKKAGYLYEDMRPELSLDSASLNAISATLEVYTEYTYETIDIRECVMSAVLAYLKSSNALATYTE